MKLLWKCFVAAAALALSIPAQAQEEKPAPAMTHPPAVDYCNSCNSCNDDCDRGVLLADFGFLILKPYWKTNPAMIIVNDTDGVRNAIQKDFTDATQFVPRIALGYLNSGGFGARIGWWGFATSQTDFIGNDGDLTIVSAGPLGLAVDDGIGGMAASMALRFDVWDLEVLQRIDKGCWDCLLSGGVRYVHMSQDYNAVDIDQGGVADETLLSGHNFNGAGPTVALNVRRGVGEALYVTSTVRGSLLFGQGEQTATLLDQPGAVIAVANSSYDMVLPVGEIEVGGGWARSLGRQVAFVEGGVAAQGWIDAGNASRSDNADSLGPIFGGTTSDPTLGLFGFYLKAGLTY